MSEYWIASATYEDGYEIERAFAYTANGNYSKECKEEHEIECFLADLANEHGAWTSMNVVYQQD